MKINFGNVKEKFSGLASRLPGKGKQQEAAPGENGASKPGAKKRKKKKKWLKIVIALVLFVAVSVAMAVYTARMNAVMEPKEPPASQKSDEERREAFIAKYGLTEREWDVFSQMISSDSSAQEIADCLFLSKRTVERHISALYEKTGAKSRITMYLLYRND